MSVIVIEDWMIQEKNLSGLDLLAFALVHGCTQKGEGCWYGGYDRLAERIGGKQRGTIMAVNRLEEIGAVERFDAVIDGKPKRAIRSLWYSAQNADAKNADAKNADAQNAEPTLQKMQSSSAKNAEPSNSNNIQSKKKVFIKPTIEDIAAYCRENGINIDPNYFYDHYESNGWKIGGKSPMKDWQATIRNWARNQKSSAPSQLFSSPQVAPAPSSKDEDLYNAMHPTKEKVNEYFNRYFLPQHPMKPGESREEYKARTKPFWDADYKSWIERRVDQVNNKY